MGAALFGAASQSPEHTRTNRAREHGCSDAHRRKTGAPPLGSRRVTLEVCIDSVASAVAARNGGASSVELCANLVEGGTTPSLGMIRQVRQAVGDDVALHVIIRPRGGDFCYSDEEIGVMLDDIAVSRGAGADGVVLGALTTDGNVDLVTTGRLLDACGPQLAVTFHRAIDLTCDPVAALQDLLCLKIDRVLTSGGAPSAIEGAQILAAMDRVAADSGVVVVPGGGINSENVKDLVMATGTRMVHASLRTTKTSPMTFRKTSVPMGLAWNGPDTEYTTKVADATTVAQVVSILEIFDFGRAAASTPSVSARECGGMPKHLTDLINDLLVGRPLRGSGRAG